MEGELTRWCSGQRRQPALCILTLLGAGVILCALMLLGWSASPASAVPSTTLPSGTVLRGDARTQVDSLQAQAAAVQADIDRLDVQIEQLAESYNELSAQIDATNVELSALRRQLDAAKASYEYRKNLLDERLRAAYKARDNNVLEILLATHSFSDFVKRCVLVSKLATNDQRIVTNYQSSMTQLAATEVKLQAKKSDNLKLRERLAGKRSQIEASLKERETTLKGLDSQIAAIVEQERLRQEEERKRLETELRSQLATWQKYDGPLPRVDDRILQQVVETAAAYLGIPYVWSGSKPSTGLDCSGLTSYVFRQHGVELPHYSVYQSQMGLPVALSDIRAGDLLAFGTPVHHVGIYIGDGKFIHAPRTGDVVKISKLAARKDLNTIRRFPLKARLAPPALD